MINKNNNNELNNILDINTFNKIQLYLKNKPEYFISVGDECTSVSILKNDKLLYVIDFYYNSDNLVFNPRLSDKKEIVAYDFYSLEELMSFEENFYIKKILKDFNNQMLTEIINNKHKGDILNFSDFNSIITEIEYHKAKLFFALKEDNKLKIKEYIADIANLLMVLGYNYNIYE